MPNILQIGRTGALATCFCLLAAGPATDPPPLLIESDNTIISDSATLALPDQPLRDEDHNGVIHIRGDDLTIDLAGLTLRGAAPDTPPNQLTGIGIVVTGRNITIRNGSITGYKVGLYAKNAPGLVLEDLDVSGNFRQRLASTRAREATSDWLWPHNNDSNEWMSRYGAAVYVEDSDNVTLRRIRIREGQNGILLDNVNDSRIYDNDCSFLSGWGLALWRASRNTITRNAFDFCIRGYSHGVYNRGQDSAGILMFEQCSDNIIAENSATHGGDGLFAFAGREALGEDWMANERDRLRRETGERDVDHLIEVPEEIIERTRGIGNNRNLFVGNDFSYAAAHGLELTFSFDNRIVGNRFVGNAICGIWGGYSQNTEIRGNIFIGNGDAGYGLERGGVNIEHGYNNQILQNAFHKNRCGVHLWWNADARLLRLPWAIANEKSSQKNAIIANVFEGDELAIHLRECGETTIARNVKRNVGKEIEAVNSEPIVRKSDPLAPPDPLQYEAFGETRPVGAREHLAGRDRIIVTQWGPWDWQSPLALFQGRNVDEEGRPYLSYLLLGETMPTLEVVDASKRGLIVERHDDPTSDALVEVRIIATEPGVHEIEVKIDGAPEGKRTETHELLVANWTVKHFAWETDPRENVEAWRAEAADAIESEHAVINFVYGMGGPGSGLPSDRFGTIATATLPLPAGTWRIRTVSDDGVRVWVDEQIIIDNWTWHAPTEDIGEFTLDDAKAITIRVEHFELDGYAILTLDLERAQ